MNAEKNTDKNSKISLTSPIGESLKKNLLAEKTTYVAARSSKLPLGVAEKIITDLIQASKLDTPEQALVLLAMIFQQGGTSRSCDGNMAVTYLGKTVKLADIRKILKANSCSKGERKLARTLADRIHEIAEIMEIPGNLSQKAQRQNLDRRFEMKEKVWLSDFQSDNENCPIELRKLIQETFKKPTGNTKKKK